MFRSLNLSLLALLAMFAGGAALADVSAPNAAIETSTARITMPSVGGSLTARNCRSCPYLALTLVDSTRYFVGQQELSADTFRKAIADGQPRSLTIIYERDSRLMTRLVLAPGSVRLGARN